MKDFFESNYFWQQRLEFFKVIEFFFRFQKNEVTQVFEKKCSCCFTFSLFLFLKKFCFEKLTPRNALHANKMKQH